MMDAGFAANPLPPRPHVAVAVGSFLILLGLPGIIGGWALLTGRSWGRPLVLVLGILSLFNIPIGTAVGIYTLWALLSDASESPPRIPGWSRSLTPEPASRQHIAWRNSPND
jgi:hypothetical protein